MELFNNDKGQAGIVGVIITVSLTIIVGIMLVGQFTIQSDVTMETGELANDTTAQTAYDNIKSNTWGAFNIMAMYPWILGAVAILGAVMMISGRR
jgi:flagellin-like protein